MACLVFFVHVKQRFFFSSFFFLEKEKKVKKTREGNKVR